MKIFLAVLIVISSSIAFAQAKGKARVASKSDHPVHSILNFTPHGKFQVEGDLAVGFGAFTRETTGALIQFEEFETTTIINEYAFEYGVLPQLAIGMNIGYLSSAEKNTSYRDSLNSFGVPLQPDVTDKGITDPELTARFRILDGSLVADVNGALRLAFMDAERGSAFDSADGDSQEELAKDGNSASGSYAATVGGAVGLQISDRLLALALLNVEYNFAGQVTLKQESDIVADTDAYTTFTPRIEAQYLLTPEFALHPYFEVEVGSKQKLDFLLLGSSIQVEQDAANVYTLGLQGDYLLIPELAIRAGYAWSTIDSAKVRQRTNNGPAIETTNAKDRDIHAINIGAIFQF